MKRIAPSLAALAVAMAPLVAGAHEFIYLATLNGSSEMPPNDSPGAGFAVVTLDLDLFTMRVEVDFQGLEGTVVSAHIHGNTVAPVQGLADVITTMPTFPGFPSGVTAGSYDQSFDMTLPASYNPAFLAASGGTVSLASNSLIAGLNAGTTYLNVHTSEYGGGEIRGFLLPTPKSDFNRDGRVDGEDLAKWQVAYTGHEHDHHHGDANDDGRADGADFLIWQRQYSSVAAPLPPAGATTVPEPAAPALAVISSASLIGTQRVRKLRHAKYKLLVKKSCTAAAVRRG